MGKVLAVIGKGGSGRTSVTALLGMALAERGKKVLLIDVSLGLRGLDLPLGLENEVFYHLADVLLQRCSAEDAVLEVPGWQNLSLLPAAQGKFPLDVSPVSMKILLRHLQEQYDCILMDSAGGVERGFSLSVAGAEEVVIVLAPDRAGIRAATRFADLAKEEGVRDGWLFFNRIASDPESEEEMEEAQELLGLPVLGCAGESRELHLALDRGSLCSRESFSVPESFRDAACRLLGEQKETPGEGDPEPVSDEKKTPKRGLWARLLSQVFRPGP